MSESEALAAKTGFPDQSGLNLVAVQNGQLSPSLDNAGNLYWTVTCQLAAVPLGCA